MDVVNKALRRGLNDLTARPKRRETFRTQTVELRRLRLAGTDNISETLSIAEVKRLNDFG
jgi:hypothetical protein